MATDLPKGVALLGDLTAVLNSVLAGATDFADKVKNYEIDTSKVSAKDVISSLTLWG